MNHQVEQLQNVNYFVFGKELLKNLQYTQEKSSLSKGQMILFPAFIRTTWKIFSFLILE